MTRFQCGFAICVVTVVIVYCCNVIVNKLEKTTESFQNQFRYVEYVDNNNSNSQERRHIAYLKVHKTGSSTIQNIFLRFGQYHNLTFILSHDKAGLAEQRELPNVISFRNSLNDRNIVPPPSGSSYDIMCCHVIYKRSQFEKYLPKDTVYIGSVREPIERLESAIHFFKLFGNINFAEYAKHPYKYNHYVGSMTNNRMAFEFGFPSSLFLESNVSKLNKIDLQIITDYLDKIQLEFDVILIKEKFNHSIILMKRTLHWHIKDVLYITKMEASKGKRLFLDNEKEKIMSYLYLDYMLYNRAFKELNNKIEHAGNDLEEEVKHYVQVLDHISYFCKLQNSIKSIYIEESKWDSSFNFTKTECEMYTKPEIAFVQEIRKRQYGQIDI